MTISSMTIALVIALVVIIMPNVGGVIISFVIIVIVLCLLIYCSRSIIFFVSICCFFTNYLIWSITALFVPHNILSPHSIFYSLFISIAPCHNTARTVTTTNYFSPTIALRSHSTDRTYLSTNTFI